jgi:diacylglycerol kinase (ATP)
MRRFYDPLEMVLADNVARRTPRRCASVRPSVSLRDQSGYTSLAVSTLRNKRKTPLQDGVFGMVGTRRIELLTPTVSMWCSPTELRARVAGGGFSDRRPFVPPSGEACRGQTYLPVPLDPLYVGDPGVVDWAWPVFFGCCDFELDFFIDDFIIDFAAVLEVGFGVDWAPAIVGTAMSAARARPAIERVSIKQITSKGLFITICVNSNRPGPPRLLSILLREERSVRSAVLVANHAARQTAAEFAKAREMLEARGVRLTMTHVVDDHNDLCRFVRRAVKNGTQLIIVAGGDGTMTAAAGQLAKSGSVMGVLPLGTGNSFALSLGITDLTTAVDAIVDGRTAHIDLGRVNGTYFANFATIGLSSAIAEATPNRLKKIVGAAAYVLAGFIPALRARPFRCRVRVNKQKIEFPTYQVIVANGRFFGHTPLTAEASLTSGQLTFYSTTDTTIADAAKTYASLLLDRQSLLPNAHIIEATALRVRAKPRQALAIDGEQCGTTPARFAVVPNALRVMVPNVTPAAIP